MRNPLHHLATGILAAGVIVFSGWAVRQSGADLSTFRTCFPILAIVCWLGYLSANERAGFPILTRLVQATVLGATLPMLIVAIQLWLGLGSPLKMIQVSLGMGLLASGVIGLYWACLVACVLSKR